MSRFRETGPARFGVSRCTTRRRPELTSLRASGALCRPLPPLSPPDSPLPGLTPLEGHRHSAMMIPRNKPWVLLGEARGTRGIFHRDALDKRF